MPSPAAVFGDPIQLLLGAVLAVLLVLFIAFPAEFFNRTFEENHEKISGWFRRVPRLSWLKLPSWAQLIGFALATTVLLIFVIPEDHFSQAALVQMIGFLVVAPLVVVILEIPGALYAWRKHHRSMQLAAHERPERPGSQWRVLPSALLVAGFLALLSILAKFDPPYIYGLFAVYVGAHPFLNKLDEEEKREAQGRHTLIGMLSVTAASVLAWFGWVLLNRTFVPGSMGFGWLIADSVLATTFLLGLEAVVFGMIPLAFLKGQEVWRWRRVAWAAVFLPVALFFVRVQLVVRKGESLGSAEVTKSIMLFVVFGIFSLLFWASFHPRVRRRFARLR